MNVPCYSQICYRSPLTLRTGPYKIAPMKNGDFNFHFEGSGFQMKQHVGKLKQLTVLSKSGVGTTEK